MTAGKVLFAILTSSTELVELTSLRIFPEIAPQEAAAPFVVYTIDSVEPQPTKDSTIQLDEVRATVYVVGDNYATVQDTAEEVRAAIDRARGTFNGVGLDSANYESEEISFDDNARQYVQEQRFTLRISRTGTVPNTGSTMITIQESDGTPSGQVDTLRVPSNQLTIASNVATLSFPTSNMDAAAFPVQASTANVNVTSAAAVTVELNTPNVTTGTFYALGSTSVTLSTAGTYLITASVKVTAEGSTTTDLVQWLQIKEQNNSRPAGPPGSCTIQAGESAYSSQISTTALVQSDGTNIISAEVYAHPQTTDVVNVRGGELQVVRLT